MSPNKRNTSPATRHHRAAAWIGGLLGVGLVSTGAAVGIHSLRAEHEISPLEEYGVAQQFITKGAVPKGDALIQVTGGYTPITLAQHIATRNSIDKVTTQLEKQTEGADGIMPTAAWAVVEESDLNHQDVHVVKEQVIADNPAKLPVVEDIIRK